MQDHAKWPRARSLAGDNNSYAKMITTINIVCLKV